MTSYRYTFKPSDDKSAEPVATLERTSQEQLRALYGEDAWLAGDKWTDEEITRIKALHSDGATK